MTSIQTMRARGPYRCEGVAALRSAAIQLLAAAAVAASVTAQTAPASVVVEVGNPLPLVREDEVVRIPWAALTRQLPAARPDAVRVRAGAGAEVPAQVVDENGDGSPDALLLLASVWPGATARFAVEAAPPAQPARKRVHVRHDAPRDDLAWENDRIAFRMYGQGLKRTPNAMSSSGIDVWTKRTDSLILEKWYAKGADAYHTDVGEGADFFDVGTTLGAGGTAVWRNDSLHRADNFDRYRVLANGPVRAIFEVDHDTWNAAGLRVTETKRVTIDAGQHLYRIESVFRSPDADTIPYAIGLVKRPGMVGTVSSAQPWAWLSGWGPVSRRTGGHGELGTAVLLPAGAVDEWKELGTHYVATARAPAGLPVVHYAGSAWTAAGRFPTPQSWWTYLDEAAQRIAHPLTVRFVP